MKNNAIIIPAIVLLANLATGCKKSNDAASSVKDKTWWGVITYTGKDAELYSLHFNTNNTFIWSQFSGDYTGQWSISDKELTMTFDAGKSEMKAYISDDSQLVNITDNSGNSIINSCQLIANPHMPLDNTKWSGYLVGVTIPYIVDISFRAPLTIDIGLQGNHPNNTYTRSASGAVIRTEILPTGAGGSSRFFGILISDSEMMGSEKDVTIQWKVTKK